MSETGTHCAKVFDSCLMMKKVHFLRGRVVCSHERPKGNNSFLVWPSRIKAYLYFATLVFE